ncbi:MAG: STAS domain-containing protein [Spirochaetes bacterium]|nr:STAS domain-containing protein [Spirochaetota bacterium]
MAQSYQILFELIIKNEKALIASWLENVKNIGRETKKALSASEIEKQSKEFLAVFFDACKQNNPDIHSKAWEEVRDFLINMSKEWAVLGMSSGQAARFIFSLKQSLFEMIAKEQLNEGTLNQVLWDANLLLDELGLFVIETYQKSREDIIKRQQQELLELSTPVVKIWNGILILPLIGTLDSARTQVVLENLLQSIVDTESQIAIIDITGVPTVDTLVAQHLLKTVAASRLMGTQCIISGIRPQIAQTMVHLGVTFSDVVTKATLADALFYAFNVIGFVVQKKA